MVNGAGYRLTYTLDRNGNRTVMVDPDGGKTTFTWDHGDRLSTIANPWGERTTITYDALDRELKKTLGNGVQVSHVYDAAGRETSLWNVGPTGVALAIFTQTFDPVGNALSSQELDGTRVTWLYDVNYQLKSEQRSGANAYNITYGFDALGNRTSKNDSGSVTNYTYNQASEQTLLTPPTGQPTTSSYDANGNLTLENAGGQLTSYSWEGENRLTGVAYPTGAPDTMSYSADGLRQKKVSGGTTSNFVWDEQNVLQEKDATGATQAQYSDYPGRWGGLVSQRRSGGSSFFGFDQQGSTRILETSAGAQSDQYVYRAFGEEALVSGTTVNPLRYVGQVGYYRDAASRLYVRSRHLGPVSGRWLSQDDEDRFDPSSPGYPYLDNCAVSWRDPSGAVLNEWCVRNELRKLIPAAPPADKPCVVPNGIGPRWMVWALGYASCYRNMTDWGDDFLAPNDPFTSGNLFFRCASCVNLGLCNLMRFARRVPGCAIVPAEGEVLWFEGQLVLSAIRCQNECMRRAVERRSGPGWRLAEKECCRMGLRSFACCEASFREEQNEYTRCAGKCPTIVGRLLLRRIPYWLRVNFGLHVVHCCHHGDPFTGLRGFFG